jgi:hypothetical protein
MSVALLGNVVRVLRTFTRRDGTEFEVEVTVDVDKLAQSLARKLTWHDRERATVCDGAVVAKRVRR